MWPKSLALPLTLFLHLAIERKIEKEMQHFREILSSTDCERFTALNDLQMEASCLTEADAFCAGFKLGAKLVAASIADDGSSLGGRG